MSNKNKSVVKSDIYSKKSKAKSINQFHSEEDEFFDNILDIDLSKPRSGYNIFSKDYYASLPESDKKLLTDHAPKISEKWKNANNNVRDKYNKKALEDRNRYDLHLAKVKKFLINPDRIKEYITPYSLFRDAFIYDEMLNNKIPKSKAITLAREAYKQLSEEEREEWKNHYNLEKKMLNEIGDFKPGKTNAYAEFIHDKVKNERINYDKAKEMWKKCSKQDLEKYERIAQEINKEKDKKRDLYEMISEEPPKKPVGSFGLFLADKSGEGNIDKNNNFIVECRDMWQKLSDEEKLEYDKKHKALSIKYELKKSEYLKNLKNLKPKNISGYNLFQSEHAENVREKKGEDYTFEKGEFFGELSKMWASLTNTEKEEYNNRAKEMNEENLQRSEILLNKPVKPTKVYAQFVKDHLTNNENNYKGLSQAEKFKKASQAWKKTSDRDKQKYYEIYENAKEKYDEEITNYIKDLEDYEKNYQGKSKSKSKIKNHIQSQILKSQTKLISSKSKSQNAITALNKSKNKNKNLAENLNTVTENDKIKKSKYKATKNNK